VREVKLRGGKMEGERKEQGRGGEGVGWGVEGRGWLARRKEEKK